MQSSNFNKRKCNANKCKKLFYPVTVTQKYCSKVCKNREGQRRLRERAKIRETLEVLKKNLVFTSTLAGKPKQNAND